MISCFASAFNVKHCAGVLDIAACDLEPLVLKHVVLSPVPKPWVRGREAGT